MPVKKAPSNLDVGLAVGGSDDEYLASLDQVLTDIIEIPADLIVYNAGVDVHKDDDLGHLNVSSSGIILREKRVLNFAKKRKTPLEVTLGGGYQKNVANIAFLHFMILKEIANGF